MAYSSACGGPLMNVWKIVKKQAAVLGHLALLGGCPREQSNQRIFGKGRERALC
jgi:hypothetical protein